MNEKEEEKARITKILKLSDALVEASARAVRDKVQGSTPPEYCLCVLLSIMEFTYRCAPSEKAAQKLIEEAHDFAKPKGEKK